MPKVKKPQTIRKRKGGALPVTSKPQNTEALHPQVIHATQAQQTALENERQAAQHRQDEHRITEALALLRQGRLSAAARRATVRLLAEYRLRHQQDLDDDFPEAGSGLKKKRKSTSTKKKKASPKKGGFVRPANGYYPPGVVF